MHKNNISIQTISSIIQSHKSKFKTALSITFLPFYTLYILKYTYFSFFFESISLNPSNKTFLLNLFICIIINPKTGKTVKSLSIALITKESLLVSVIFLFP